MLSACSPCKRVNFPLALPDKKAGYARPLLVLSLESSGMVYTPRLL